MLLYSYLSKSKDIALKYTLVKVKVSTWAKVLKYGKLNVLIYKKYK